MPCADYDCAVQPQIGNNLTAKFQKFLTKLVPVFPLFEDADIVLLPLDLKLQQQAEIYSESIRRLSAVCHHHIVE